jgi:hypothetical protein
MANIAPKQPKAVQPTNLKSAPVLDSSTETPPIPQRGRLAAMSEKDANEYIGRLLDPSAADSKTTPKLEGMEAEVLKKFRAAASSSQRIAQRIQQLRQELEGASTALQKYQGQIDAYSGLLVSAEDDRRNAKAPTSDAKPLPNDVPNEKAKTA